MPDLREREAVLHRGAHVDPGEQRRERYVEELAHDNDERHDEDRRLAGPQRGRVDKEPDGDEERRREHRLERIDERREPLAHVARRADDADEERAEREREVEVVGEERDEEAHAEERERKRLVVLTRRDGEQQPRHEDHSEHKHGEEEHGEPSERAREGGGGHPAAGRESRDDGYRADAYYVLAQRRAEDVLGERTVPPAHLVDDLREQRRGGIAHRDAEESGLDRRPSEDAGADGVSEPYHHHRVQDCGWKRDGPYLLHLLRGERQAHREHQEHDAELSDGAYGLRIPEEADAERVLAHQRAGEDVSDHLRPAETGEKRRRKSGDGHQQREIAEKRAFAHLPLGGFGSRPFWSRSRTTAFTSVSKSPRRIHSRKFFSRKSMSRILEPFFFPKLT